MGNLYLIPAHLLTHDHCVFSQARLSAILCLTMGPSILFTLVMDFIDQLTAEAASKE